MNASSSMVEGLRFAVAAVIIRRNTCVSLLAPKPLFLRGHAQMTSAPRGGEGVAQNLTITDTGEGGGSLILTSYLKPL